MCIRQSLWIQPILPQHDLNGDQERLAAFLTRCSRSCTLLIRMHNDLALITLSELLIKFSTLSSLPKLHHSEATSETRFRQLKCSHISFSLKVTFFKTGLKVTKYLGYFWSPKTDQSGHTEGNCKNKLDPVQNGCFTPQGDVTLGPFQCIAQCDQIGLILNDFCDNFLHKSSKLNN